MVLGAASRPGPLPALAPDRPMSDNTITCSRGAGRSGVHNSPVRLTMWQKPEFEVVEVTMEVTAYVARR
jgi:coenzyme PQQ precursor peptide PqqA